MTALVRGEQTPAPWPAHVRRAPCASAPALPLLGLLLLRHTRELWGRASVGQRVADAVDLASAQQRSLGPRWGGECGWQAGHGGFNRHFALWHAQIAAQQVLHERVEPMRRVNLFLRQPECESKSWYCPGVNEIRTEQRKPGVFPIFVLPQRFARQPQIGIEGRRPSPQKLSLTPPASDGCGSVHRKSRLPEESAVAAGMAINMLSPLVLRVPNQIGSRVPQRNRRVSRCPLVCSRCSVRVCNGVLVDPRVKTVPPITSASCWKIPRRLRW